MKKVLFLFLPVAILIFAWGSQSAGFLENGNFFSRSICDKPLAYRIGTIDSRFGIKREEVVNYLDRASNIWEEPASKNLFAYDPNASLKVDFVYDKKQALNSQITDLEGQLDQGREDFEEKKAQFERQVLEFNQKVDDLNYQIRYWNSQGGAPPDQYRDLTAKRRELEAEAQRLNSLAKELNLSASEYNLNIGKLNQKISQFNLDLQRKPEEGLYDEATLTIQIYFVPSETELVHTLAHELGHARGLGHVDASADSIMFAYSSESTAATSEDLASLNNLCRERSLVEVAVNNLSVLIERYFAIDLPSIPRT